MNKQMPEHLSLIKENPDHFLIHDAKDNKAFQVSKRGLHPATQMHVLRMKKYSEGGQIKKMSDGGEEDGGNWADQPGADLSNFSQDFQNRAMAQAPQPQVTAQASQIANPPPSQAPQVTPPQVSGEKSPQAQGPAPQGGQTQGQSGMDMGMVPQGYPTLGSLNQAVGQEAGGINQAAQGQMAQNKALAEVQKQYLAIEQERNQHYQQTMQHYQQQQDQLTQDVINQKIDPEKYWENHSRVGAAIAALVGGIGAGLQHSTQNLAVGVIQDGINKSIETQKAELGKKENLLSNNLKVQGNLMQAENATRLQTAAMLQGKIAQVAAETGDPMIMGQAQQKIAQLKMATLPTQMQLAQYETQMHMRKMLSQSDTRNMDPAKLVPYVVANDRQAKVYDEIKDLENVNRIAKPSLDAFDQAAHEVRFADSGVNMSPTAVIPGMESPGQKAWRGMANTTVKDVEGTARQAAFKGLEENYMPQAWDSDETIKSKRDGWINYLRSHSSAPTAMGEHLDLSKFQSTRFPEELLVPQDQRAKEGMKASNGKNTLIFQGGRWVPVGG